VLILRAVARALGPQSGPAILLATSLAASTSSNVRTSPRGSRDDLADGRDESDRYIVSSVDVSMTVGPQTAVLARDGIDDIEQDLLPIQPLPEPGSGLLEASFCDSAGLERHLQLSVAILYQRAKNTGERK